MCGSSHSDAHVPQLLAKIDKKKGCMYIFVIKYHNNNNVSENRVVIPQYLPDIIVLLLEPGHPKYSLVIQNIHWSSKNICVTNEYILQSHHVRTANLHQ